MGFFVKIWGARGSIPTSGLNTRKYGGNTSCMEVRIDDTLFICDGGTGLRELGVDICRRTVGPIVAHMFFSHSHWDHIQGFPFFKPAFDPETTLKIYGTIDGDPRLFNLLSGQMDGGAYFPVQFSALASNIVSETLENGSRVINGTTVRYLKQNHPGTSWAYSFEKNGIKMVYATDSEIDLILPNKDEVKDNLDAPRQIPKEIVEFVRDADLLIADGQYEDDEYTTKVGWGHPRATTIVDLAVQGNVKHLAVHHHDPMHADRYVDDKIERCRERLANYDSDLVIFGAREGVEMRLD